jgi:hypothetical protein
MPALVRVAILAVLVAGCGTGASRSPLAPPAGTSDPSASLPASLAQARGEVVRALEAAGVQVDDPRAPYRPPESARFAAAPRAVVQAQLATDLAHGYVSIYAFASAGEATEAGRQQAAYVAGGPGRIQFPAGTRFVIRVLGTAVVFYAWSPGVTTDPQAPDVEAALTSIGTEVDVPS